MKTKQWRSCLVAVFLCAIPLGGLMFWVHTQTTYYVSAYRIASLVDADENAQLKRRLYPVRFDSCTIEFEWNTYDNSDITAGPYKFYVVAVPNRPELKSVTIRSLGIVSSLGKVYDSEPMDGALIKLMMTPPNERVAGKMDRAFAFDFDAGENISMTLLIEFDFGDTRETQEITLDWKPVRVRYWTSIV